ncbi:MAG: signal peptidase I [Candidatus Kaiserbacteria bacterium]|nr:signal peptidase I [Candidatus Kaiserbacteria bacterium]
MTPERNAQNDERSQKGEGAESNASQNSTSNSISEKTSAVPAQNQKQSRDSQPSLLAYTVMALGLALFIRFFVAAPYVVSGSSMEPTFLDWHYLIIDKVIYDISSPVRGDVIVLNLPQDAGRSLIKRIIGLPGETVKISGSIVTITNSEYPKGLVLKEPYIDPKNASNGDSVEVNLGSDEYFVLGDNRHVSADSRIWGKLPKKDIVGRVDARLFPFNAISVLPGTVRY